MATSSKFDISSDSPDRPAYSSGQRGSHLTAQLDRSGSFHESMENPILSSLPNMSRSSSTISQGDVVSFFQCLRFDLKNVAAEHKRQGDFKRHIYGALGVSADESPSGSSKNKALQIPPPEEIKRVKASLRESYVKARYLFECFAYYNSYNKFINPAYNRDRVKIFNEALSVLNKFFPSVPTKKRFRSEGFPGDRSGTLLCSDRSTMGSSLGKMGIQNHAASGVFEPEQQKQEERTKNAVPNKRTRTSLVDVRSNSLVRPSSIIDRDREMVRLANSGSSQNDDRTLSMGVDGWEKTKMKKKRSAMKPDVSPNLGSAKPLDGYREPKQGIQQRPVIDARTRLNSDAHCFRPGVSNGAVGVAKSDGVSQTTALNVRSSLPRVDIDNGSLLNDRRERSVGSDKEKTNLRTFNKANVRDDFSSASPTSSTKMNSSIRAPRSGTGVAPKLSPVVQRATAPNDWELSPCTNKPPTVGPNNRKRTISNRSSSPPVAHWAGQRPQKISRTARRTNLVPIVPNNDESPTLDTVSDVSGNENGLGFTRRMTASSPQQVKLKGDPLSSSALSESEESGAPEIKSKDKGKKSDEIDEKVGPNVQKISSIGFPSRKNKLISGEDLGDGVRRQGRTGRGFTSTRVLTPMAVEKPGNVGTAKQLRSTRVGFDKSESKTGRPTTRKLSDRKAYARQKNTTVNAAADFLVGSDDGHEELLAAASAVINPAHAISSPSFWKQMESFFSSISDADISYLKQQGNFDAIRLSPSWLHTDANNCNSVANGYGLDGYDGEDLFATIATSSEKREQSSPALGEITLCQRLMAAIIPEEDCSHGNGELESDTYGTGFEMDGELGSNGLNHLDTYPISGHSTLNCYKVTGKPAHDEAEIDTLGISNMDIYSNFSHSVNGVLSDHSELQYDSMQINEKLRLELQSIGIFPDPMPEIKMEDEGIGKEIRILEDKYREQVMKKKILVDKVLQSASDAKELQEKEFEQRAYDKLVTMAYQKYMACWGPGSGKSSSNKVAKQAALAFVKRTLERYHEFEETGKGCFSEPLFRDMFLSGFPHGNGAQLADAPTEGESGKLYGNASNHSMEGRASVSMGSQPSPRTSRLDQNAENYSSHLLPPVNRLSEQTNAKEDIWSNRVKKRELLLDDVGGGTVSTSSAPSGIGGSLSSSTKGKRSERDRDGKGHSREVLSRNGTNKTGRPGLSNSKGERKSKTKPKQKMTQLSVSVNGLLGKTTDQTTPTPPEAKLSKVAANSNAKNKYGLGLDVLDDRDGIDFSNLLPGIDDDGQGQDIGSWLDIEDDGLQDHDDFMGLEIPMDDLSDLNMMV